MRWTFDRTKLTTLRDMKGLTQAEFALRIGTRKQHVSAMETGKIQPNIKTLTKICSEFDVEPKVFFARSENHDGGN